MNLLSCRLNWAIAVSHSVKAPRHSKVNSNYLLPELLQQGIQTLGHLGKQKTACNNQIHTQHTLNKHTSVTETTLNRPPLNKQYTHRGRHKQLRRIPAEVNAHATKPRANAAAFTVKMRRPVLSNVTQYTDDRCPRILLCIFMCWYTAVGTSCRRR